MKKKLEKPKRVKVTNNVVLYESSGSNGSGGTDTTRGFTCTNTPLPTTNPSLCG